MKPFKQTTRKSITMSEMNDSLGFCFYKIGTVNDTLEQQYRQRQRMSIPG